VWRRNFWEARPETRFERLARLSELLEPGPEHVEGEAGDLFAGYLAVIPPPGGQAVVG
jgi:hypothetical protein